MSFCYITLASVFFSTRCNISLFLTQFLQECKHSEHSVLAGVTAHYVCFLACDPIFWSPLMFGMSVLLCSFVFDCNVTKMLLKCQISHRDASLRWLDHMFRLLSSFFCCRKITPTVTFWEMCFVCIMSRYFHLIGRL